MIDICCICKPIAPYLRYSRSAIHQLFYTIGKELPYRIKKPRPVKGRGSARCTTRYIIRPYRQADAFRKFRIIWLPVTEEFRLRLLEFPLSARSSEVIFSISYSHRTSTRAGSL